MTGECIVCAGADGELYVGAHPNGTDPFVCRPCQKSPMPQLRAFLERGRAAGFTFERAWPWALERVKWPHDTATRREWKRLLGLELDQEHPGQQRRDVERIVAGWKGAYLRLPAPPAERPLLDLVAA